MYLIEIFRSIQGESSFAGLPCIFVRLAGCNLRCSWCDSEYSFAGGYKATSDQIVEEIEKFNPVRLVELTGGEPMLQHRELLPLMSRLLDSSYTLMLETSGERPLAAVPPEVHKIVDVKCPGSGHAGSFHLPNLEVMGAGDQAKFVLCDRTDYEYARSFIREHTLEGRVGEVLLSPAFLKNPSEERSTSNAVLDPKDLVGWMLEDGLKARLSLQIHKYIWPPATKGV